MNSDIRKEVEDSVNRSVCDYVRDSVYGYLCDKLGEYQF